MGWGNAVEKIGGMIDGIFGLSPEQRKRKIKDKIDKLEQERKGITNAPVSNKSSARLSDIDVQLVGLYKELGNN